MLTGVVEVGLFCQMAQAAYFGNEVSISDIHQALISLLNLGLYRMAALLSDGIMGRLNKWNHRTIRAMSPVVLGFARSIICRRIYVTYVNSIWMPPISAPEKAKSSSLRCDYFVDALAGVYIKVKATVWQHYIHCQGLSWILLLNCYDTLYPLHPSTKYRYMLL